LCLWQSSVDLPNCGILLGHEEDRETENEEGECRKGQSVKLHGGSIRAALAAPIIFVKFERWC